MKRSIHISHILQSQKRDPIKKPDHTIRSRCACVWNFFWMELIPLYAWLNLLFWDMGYPFFFLFSFSFSHAFGHRYFFLFVSHSPYSFCNMKSHVKMIEHFCVDESHIFCTTSDVGMRIYGVYVILILKAWNESHKGRKQFVKAQCKTSSICVRFSKMSTCIWLC